MNYKDKHYLDDPINISGSHHVILSSKGGVGKSYIALILSTIVDFGIASGDINPLDVKLLDLDMVNRSFKMTLKDRVLAPNIFKQGQHEADEISLAEYLLPTPGDVNETKIIDTGSILYYSIISAILQTGAYRDFKEQGKKLVFHVPLCGFDRLHESLIAFLKIVQDSHNEATIVAWLNDYQLNRREAGTSISLQTFVERGIELSKHEEILSVDELIRQISLENFSGLNNQQIASAYFHLMSATNDGKNTIVLANAQKAGLASVINCIEMMIQSHKPLNEYIDSPDIMHSVHNILVIHFFDNIFPDAFRVLKNIFG